MANVAARRWALPTREDVRPISRWVWVLLVMAALFVVLRVLSATPLQLDIAAAAVVAAAPLLAAAALMYVAPRERLVALASLGFAVLPTVRLAGLIVDTRALYPPWLPDIQYADISQTAGSIFSRAASFGWAFTLMAALLLAFYVGPVRSRLGWTMVAVGLLLAATGILRHLASLPPADQFPEFWSIEELAQGALVQLTVVVWAYLAAVAFDRRLLILAFAGLARLIAGVVGLVSFGAFASLGQDASVDAVNGLNALFGGLASLQGLLFWALLVAGILLELPRAVAPIAPVPSLAPEG